MNLPPKTLRDLEWDDLLVHLAAEAATEPGRARCRGLRPLADAGMAHSGATAVSEMRALLDDGRDLSFGGAEDLAALLDRLGKRAVLDGEELVALARVLAAAARTRRMLLEPCEPETPRLREMAAALPDLSELADEVLNGFDEQGQVANTATPALEELRVAAESLQRSARRRIEELVEGRDTASMLQDEYYTIRGDRYVLPIKTEHRRQLGGIVHHYSSTGQTVFLEPPEMVELNNKLLLALAEVEAETARVLAELSRKLAASAADIRTVLDGLAALDLVRAKARLADRLDATEPAWATGGEWHLENARHPLLALMEGGPRVVPNTLDLGGSFTTLVVTGANAGGKTVTLKTLGLITLMAASGMHVPADPGSRVSFPSGLFTDIGDEQSLLDARSTFSGHLANLAQILGRVGSGALLLLDELAGGTDPAQGAGLAVAFVERLAATDARIVVTSHYAALKAHAAASSDCENASVGVDSPSRRPNYRLRYGRPGGSDALSVAREVGLPAELIDRAEALIGGDTLRFEHLLQDLEQRIEAVEEERRGVETARRAAEREARQELAEAEAEARRQAEALGAERSERAEAFSAARSELASLVREAQRAGSVRTADTARRRVEQLEQEVQPPEMPGSSPGPPGSCPAIEAPEQLVAGTPVRVVSLGQDGEAEGPPRDGRVVVRLGVLEGRFPVEDLLLIQAPAGRTKHGGSSGPQPAPAPAEHDLDEAFVTPETTCDLRGMRVAEAEAEAAAFLDRIFLKGEPFGLIIHGHGTGALKSAIREQVAASEYVRDWRPGRKGEGGDGVTVVAVAR